MKYIFDFDDVLFDTTRFKDLIFQSVAKESGIIAEDIEQEYRLERKKNTPFSLRDFLLDIFADKEKTERVYKQIMKEAHNFVNAELIQAIHRFGKNNCYIVTNGETEFNTDKLKYSGIWDLFDEDKIYIVPKGKREKVAKIYNENPSEDIIFIDDKVEFIEEIKILKSEGYSNLTIFTYDSNLLKILPREEDIPSELKKIR